MRVPFYTGILIVSLLPSLTTAFEKTRFSIENHLRKTVSFLSEEIGPRSFRDPKNLAAASKFLQKSFRNLGYEVTLQTYSVDGLSAENIIAEKKGVARVSEILIIGAHYDSVVGCPGADDNASGVAVLLELARIHAKSNFSRTVRFVAFTLEEPPYFQTRWMGSRRYAKSVKEKKEKIVGMICLESLGYFSDEKNSQSFPLPFFGFFYPTTGNFVTVVSNFGSRKLGQTVAKELREKSQIPIETFTGSSLVPGVDWSDHASFWEIGVPAVMLTDTALFRNPHYHAPSDRAERLNYSKMAELTKGLSNVLEKLAE